MNKEIIEDLGGGTYNQSIRKITRIESGVKKTVVRKESKSKSLIKEIEFLISLDDNSHFPKVESYNIGDGKIFYEMPFYSLKNMGEIIIQGEINSGYCIKVIGNMLDFMFKEVFSKNIGTGTSSDLIKRTFLRVKERHNQVSEKSDILKDFIRAKNVIIDGKSYRNISGIIDELSNNKKLIETLVPKQTNMIHGDFHFGNFLVDNNNPKKFILLDPRGEKKGYDYAYDLGKFWHSFHGLYDFVHGGLFELEYKFRGDIIEVGVFEPKKIKALKTYDKIYQKRKKFVDICVENTGERNAELQILFNEAIHFCALAPFHLKNNGIEKEPISRYLMGVKLLNEFANGIK
ncbi:MAG: hypothetical protein U9O94_01175 [Nanoarchaeota archaeon]|nr:hypothetical protein [Nanoarchaeota archaeon]